MSRRRKVDLPNAAQFALDIIEQAGTAEEAAAPAVVVEAAPIVAVEADGAAERLSLAVVEVLGFCPRLLSELPEPTTLTCARSNGVPITFTTSARAFAAARAAGGAAVFTGRELAAAALAAEHERGTPSAVAEWCVHKAEDPDWRLTAEVALGGVVGRFEARGWSIGKVFARLGLELRGVEVGDTYQGGSV